MDIVVAVYNENIDWIESLKDKRLFLYLKNPNRFQEIKQKFPNANIEVLENIGRESHTYLHHICTHYYDISDCVVFLQGNPFDHCSNILNLLKYSTTPVFFGNKYECDGFGNPHHSGLPLAKLYRELFGKIRINFTFVAGAQFIIPQSTIIKHPLEFYKNLLNKHYAENLLPWCMERYWIYIFA